MGVLSEARVLYMGWLIQSVCIDLYLICVYDRSYLCTQAMQNGAGQQDCARIGLLPSCMARWATISYICNTMQRMHILLSSLGFMSCSLLHLTHPAKYAHAGLFLQL